MLNTNISNEQLEIFFTDILYFEYEKLEAKANYSEKDSTENKILFESLETVQKNKNVDKSIYFDITAEMQKKEDYKLNYYTNNSKNNKEFNVILIIILLMVITLITYFMK